MDTYFNSMVAYNLTGGNPLYLNTIPQEICYGEFLPSLSEKILKNFLPEKTMLTLKNLKLDDVDRENEKALKLGAKILVPSSSEYPQILKTLSDFPPVLYLIGKEIDESVRLSIIGPRKPTHYGLEVTKYFIDQIKDYPITTVSGLALGIDAFVHEASIKNNISTIAVLGTGIDISYPETNRGLFNKIKEHGTIISEFPIGTPPVQYNFPRRNRIIAALGRATLIVEAKPKSGSLITASIARDLGREVFSVPGNIFHYNSEGTNMLISQGAKLTRCIDDIITEKPFCDLKKHNHMENQKDVTMQPLLFKHTNETIMLENKNISNNLAQDLLKYIIEPRNLEELTMFFNKRGISFSHSVLLELEMEGLISITTDGSFVRKGIKRG